MGSNFEESLQSALNAKTIDEVENYGYCQLQEDYINDGGQTINIKIYELEGRVYFLRYVDNTCVRFGDITPTT